jgi:hypothetical protein
MFRNPVNKEHIICQHILSMGHGYQKPGKMPAFMPGWKQMKDITMGRENIPFMYQVIRYVHFFVKKPGFLCRKRYNSVISYFLPQQSSPFSHMAFRFIMVLNYLKHIHGNGGGLIVFLYRNPFLFSRIYISFPPIFPGIYGWEKIFFSGTAFPEFYRVWLSRISIYPG